MLIQFNCTGHARAASFPQSVEQLEFCGSTWPWNFESLNDIARILGDLGNLIHLARQSTCSGFHSSSPFAYASILWLALNARDLQWFRPAENSNTNIQAIQDSRWPSLRSRGIFYIGSGSFIQFWQSNEYLILTRKLLCIAHGLLIVEVERISKIYPIIERYR